MNRQQVFIVLAITLSAFGLVGLVAWFSGQQAAETTTGLDPTQRFTAKPGTTREKPLVLTSENRPSTGDFAPENLDRYDEDNAGTDQDRRIMVRSLSAPREDLSETDKSIRSAMNKLDAAAGMAELDAALAEMGDTPDRYKLHAAKARLASYLEPPDWAQAQATLDKARTAAPLGEARQEVALLSAQLALEAGNPDIARKHVEEGLAENVESPVEVELLAQAASLDEIREAYDEARTRWEQAWAKGQALAPDAQQRIEGPLRAIALRLAQRLRDDGQEDQAALVQNNAATFFETLEE